MNSHVPNTPERTRAYISDNAKRMREVNQKMFYKPAEPDSGCVKKRKLNEDEILVMDTPTKQVHPFKYDINACKSHIKW